MHLLRRREEQSNHGISRWKVSIGVVEEWNTRASSSERCFALRRCHKIKAFIEKPQATYRIKLDTNHYENFIRSTVTIQGLARANTPSLAPNKPAKKWLWELRRQDGGARGSQVALRAPWAHTESHESHEIHAKNP